MLNCLDVVQLLLFSLNWCTKEVVELRLRGSAGPIYKIWSLGTVGWNNLAEHKEFHQSNILKQNSTTDYGTDKKELNFLRIQKIYYFP